MIEGKLNGDPVPWRVYTKRGPPPPGFLAFKAWQEQIRLELRILTGNTPLLLGPVVLDATFYLPWPQSAPRKQPEAVERWVERHIIKRPDRTNIYKAFEDACQGILFVDDAQVIDGQARKRYTVGREGYTLFKCYEWRESK